ncbi:YbjQ family protein [Sphingobacterium sp. Ag1]|uniref:YbjQ family protein n=1 Tax=Sphingobacterium sp. Ag1 TaxID=1643451 RepID=UPI000A07D517|nr:heavy metal-binding domain-containing protein [Sphingobacterium sp. Ag1]
MIVSTTNSIEGREISRYNDPIAANVVICTNVFSNIGASYVDFFGGRSTSYEKKMQEICKRVTETLKQRAQTIRADAIIGLSINLFVSRDKPITVISLHIPANQSIIYILAPALNCFVPIRVCSFPSP